MNRSRLLTILGGSLGAAAALCLAGFAAGSLQPREHSATAACTIAAPVDAVWDAVRDYGRMHQWAPEVTALQRLDDVDGHPAYRMVTDEGAMTYVLVEEHPPDRLVVDLSVDPPVFGGRWTYAIEPVGGGTRVAITEDGWVDPVGFRLFLWLFDAYDDTIVSHCAALKLHLEE